MEILRKTILCRRQLVEEADVGQHILGKRRITEESRRNEKKLWNEIGKTGKE